MQKLILPNKSVLIDKLPDSLYSHLLTQCKTLEDKNTFESGVKDKNMPKHILIDNYDLLKTYILNCVKLYINEYKVTLPHTNKNIPLIVTKPWINFQKKGQFIRNHIHDGLFSYNIWIKIPYDLSKEVNSEKEATASFEFNYTDILGNINSFTIPLSKEHEGTIIFFESSLSHQVYPFYTSDEYRISIAGNVMIDNGIDNNFYPKENKGKINGNI